MIRRLFLLLMPLMAAPLGSCADQAEAQDAARLERGAPLADWADEDFSWVHDRKPYDASRALCASVRDSEPPPRDWPLLADLPALAACDSFALYHGLGVAQDFAKARHCALIDRERLAETGQWHPVDGAGMLAMIYANGAGVERDLSVALHMACQMQGAPAEMDGRIGRLEAMQSTGRTADAFDPCDDMTSGAGTSACLVRATRLDQRDIDNRLAAITASWPAPRQQAFADLRRAFAGYAAAANAMNGFGAGGGWAGVWQLGGTNVMTDRFLSRVLAVTQRQEPRPADPVTEDENTFARAATMTQDEWQALMAELLPEDRPLFEAHRRDAIAARQRFEPQLVAFMRLARPDLSAHQVRVLFRDL